MLAFRGKRLRHGVRLQVHRDVRFPSPQRAGPVRGHRPADPPEKRQQGGERTTHGQLQAPGKHQQEGQALPGPHGRAQKQEDGVQAEVKVLSRSHSPLSKMWNRKTAQFFFFLFLFLWPLKTRSCVCFNTNSKGLIELYRIDFLF